MLRAAGDASLIAVGGGTRSIGPALPPGAAEGQAVQVAIRPESLAGDPAGRRSGPAGSGPARQGGDVTFLGNLIDCHVTLDDGTRIRVQVDPGQALEVGQPVSVHIDRQSTTVFLD